MPSSLKGQLFSRMMFRRSFVILVFAIVALASINSHADEFVYPDSEEDLTEAIELIKRYENEPSPQAPTDSLLTNAATNEKTEEDKTDFENAHSGPRVLEGSEALEAIGDRMKSLLGGLNQMPDIPKLNQKIILPDEALNNTLINASNLQEEKEKSHE